MADDRTYIKLHDGMPGHPKVRGLSDKAFRTFVSALCYCSEYLTDGEVVTAVARDLGPPKVWAEMTAAGLVETAPGGYLMHDYLQHQRSSAEVQALKEKRREAGKRGGTAKAKALASARGGATEVLCSKTGSKTYPETESLTNVRDQAETDPSLRSGGAQKRARRVPSDFAPTDELRAWAHGRGFDNSQIDEITETFVRYWEAKSGRDATKLDWGKTWQNWVAKEDPTRVRATPRLVTANGERTWTSAELDAVLGVDYWRLPPYPAGMDADQGWEWEQRVKREHRAERIRQAQAKMGQSA